MRRFSQIFDRLRHLKFRQKMLLAFFVLTILPVTLIGFFSYQKSADIIKEKTREYNIDVITEVGRNIEFKLSENRRLYYAIFTNATVQNELRHDNLGFESAQAKIEARRRIESILFEAILGSDDLEAIYIYSLSGNKYNSYHVGESYWLSTDDQRRIEEARGSMVWLRPDPERLVILGGRAIYDLETQQLLGYLVLHYREKTLAQTYDQINLKQRGHIFMVDGQGRVISSPDKTQLNETIDAPYIDKMNKGETHGFFSERVDDKLVYITYKLIEGTDWRIISIIHAAQYEKEAISLKNWLLIIIGICCACFLFIAIAWSSHMSKPIRELANMMLRVEQGKFDVRYQYEYRDEIGILGRNFNKMVERINYLIHKVYQEKLLQQRSELKYLQFQINPHFLFNTLDTIHWLASMRDMSEISDMTKKLGDIMREGIKGDDFIMLANEIRNINNYLDIQKYRFRDRMNVSVDIDIDILHMKVPKFILQPIVENAIVHGVERQIGAGHIHIRGYKEDDVLIFTIKDNGPGMSAEDIAKLQLDKVDDEEQGGGIGLRNVHQRIKLYYGSDYGVHIKSEIGVGTRVTLVLPYNDRHHLAT